MLNLSVGETGTLAFEPLADVARFEDPDFEITSCGEGATSFVDDCLDVFDVFCGIS